MSVSLSVHEDYPEADWTRLVAACHGNPLHLPRVHLGDRAERGLRYLVFRRDGADTACAPAFLESERSGILSRRRRVLDLPTPPAAADRSPEARGERYRALLDLGRETGYRRLTVGLPWGEDFGDLARFAPHVTGSILEFVLDLAPEPEAILAGMHKVHRKNIRRAERHGLVVRADVSLEGLLQLRRVQETSARRATERGDGFAVRDPDYFRRVHERIYGAGVGEVLLALEGETCVAALAYLWTGSRALTVRSGSTARGYDTSAMYLLLHTALLRSRERGVTEINLGGVPADAAGEDHPQHGLHEFKKGFGGRACLRTAVSVEL